MKPGIMIMMMIIIMVIIMVVMTILMIGNEDENHGCDGCVRMMKESH